MNDFRKAERRFRELQTEHQAKRLDDQAYRLAVARLLLRDQHGVFWMIEADSGEWFCNRGDGWQKGDPHAGAAPAHLSPTGTSPSTGTLRRFRGWVALGGALALLALLAAFIFGEWPRLGQVGVESPVIQITITSPEDGSQVAVGQEIRIESVLTAMTGQPQDVQAELRVEGQTVHTQPLRFSPDETGTGRPLARASQPWHPAGTGQRLLTIVALASDGRTLGSSAITLQVVEPAGAQETGVFSGPPVSTTNAVQLQVMGPVTPTAPVNVQATFEPDGPAVRLTWEDRSDSEQAFRIYREDVRASIGLVPANGSWFLDEEISCGSTYRYKVAAFNAVGAALSDPAEVTLPPCGPDQPPTITLSILPVQIRLSETFTVSFLARDDLGVTQVKMWGRQTEDPVIDAGQVITCSAPECSGTWRLTWTGTPSATLTLLAIALDSVGQESTPAQAVVLVRPSE